MKRHLKRQICTLIEKQIERHGLNDDERLTVDGPIPISDMEDVDLIITNNQDHSFFKITLEKVNPEDRTSYYGISVILPYRKLLEGTPFVRNTLSDLRRGIQRKVAANYSTDQIQDAIPRLIQRLNEHPLS
ncbi:MAG: hypothetical protein F4X56_00920 [Gammaproteobacteria bacterium]|nr:hypothetical protein [Gammaproteobacteria bacterium]MXW06750.1 hypothetical protein [Gammaproteobacteria bacterium]MYC24462.1 hypothetical protein [Gammaproteobacteria bacterium]